MEKWMEAFHENRVGVKEMCSLLSTQCGPWIIQALIEAGVTGEAFTNYYQSIRCDRDHLVADLKDGSARNWVIGWYETKIRRLARLTLGRTGDDRHLLKVLKSFSKHFPDQAGGLAAELGITSLLQSS